MRAIAIVAHYDFSIVFKDGEYVCVMGQNNKGQRGDGTRVSKHTFLFTYMICGAKDLVEGAHHIMVLTKEGDIWTTDWNKFDQLGNKLNGYKIRFTKISYTWVKDADAGDHHNTVVKNGNVWTVGGNGKGQLGDGRWETD